MSNNERPPLKLVRPVPLAYAVPLACPTPPNLWLVVFCPFCGGTHEHDACDGADAPCGRGRYEIRDLTIPGRDRTVAEHHGGTILARLLAGVTSEEWFRIRGTARTVVLQWPAPPWP